MIELKSISDEELFKDIQIHERWIDNAKNLKRREALWCSLFLFLIIFFGILTFFYPIAINLVIFFFAMFYISYGDYKTHKGKILAWTDVVKKENHLLCMLCCDGYREYYQDFEERIKDRLR